VPCDNNPLQGGALDRGSSYKSAAWGCISCVKSSGRTTGKSTCGRMPRRRWSACRGRRPPGSPRGLRVQERGEPFDSADRNHPARGAALFPSTSRAPRRYSPPPYGSRENPGRR
jgi:hypothetical protein